MGKSLDLESPEQRWVLAASLATVLGGRVCQARQEGCEAVHVPVSDPLGLILTLEISDDGVGVYVSSERHQ